MNQTTLSDDSMVKIYEIFRKNLLESINLHRQHAQHYLAFIAAVMAATIAGLATLLNSHQQHHVEISFLVIGPAFNVCLCIIAVIMCDRFYKGFLEEVSITAKIEDLIGLSTPRPVAENSCFENDLSLLPSRWLQGRNRFKNSADFVKSSMNKGSNLVLRVTFVLMTIANIALGVIILFLR